MTAASKHIPDFQAVRTLIFDAGPLISMTTNNLLSTLENLKAEYGGRFVLPEAVKAELVDEPLHTKKFMFEALQVQRLITLGVLEVLADSETKELTLEMLHLANTCFAAKGKPLQIVHYGEMAVLAAANLLSAEAIVIDERITRELVEHPQHLAELMERRLHTSINTATQNTALLGRYFASVKIIRSVELATIAFERGLLERYVASGEEKTIPGIRQKLLESVLWGLKMSGCAVSGKEIEEIVGILSQDTKKDF